MNEIDKRIEDMRQRRLSILDMEVAEIIDQLKASRSDNRALHDIIVQIKEVIYQGLKIVEGQSHE